MVTKNILIIEPYYTGSHAAWVDGYTSTSQQHTYNLTLPGQFWQWRMMGAAITLAHQYQQSVTPDVILTTDMLNLPLFKAYANPQAPIALYFHENQLTYPTGPRQKPKYELGFINYSSALVADRVLFNSDYHQTVFFDAATEFLNRFVDFNELETLETIRQKSSVLPVGINFEKLDHYRPSPLPKNQAPLIIWNHRWEPDKDPKTFFNALYRLMDEGYSFQVALLGENFSQAPQLFEDAYETLGDRVVHYGFADSIETYARWLWRGDLIISTAHQEFFGISVVEAMYCGCYPLLPNRLSYPQFIPEAYQADMLYNSLYKNLKHYLQNRPPAPTDIAENMRQYDWRQLSQRYDAFLTNMIQ